MGDAAANRGKAFVAVLSCVLSRLVAANDAVRGGSVCETHCGPPLASTARGSLPVLRAWPQFARRRAASLRVRGSRRSPSLRAQQPASAQVVSKFHALRPPSISTRDYLERCVAA